MTRPVPTHPAQLPFTSNDRLSPEAKIYLQKLEAALKESQSQVITLQSQVATLQSQAADFEARITALEAYHP